MAMNNLNKSFYDNISNPYSDSLTLEVAELQRTIELPLLPMEKLSFNVLKAYEELGRSYWFKDDVYKSVIGNFHIPMLFPMVENPEESTELIHQKPMNRNVVSSDIGYGTERYITRTFVELIIPRHIVMQFNNIIPKGTQFCIGFIGGSTSDSAIKILSVTKTVAYQTSDFDNVMDLAGLDYDSVLDIVGDNLNKIDNETKVRKAKEEFYNAQRAKITPTNSTPTRS